MHVAIINDRVSFVRLFLENGVSLREFLTADDKVDTYLISDIYSFLYNIQLGEMILFFHMMHKTHMHSELLWPISLLHAGVLL